MHKYKLFYFLVILASKKNKEKKKQCRFIVFRLTTGTFESVEFIIGGFPSPTPMNYGETSLRGKAINYKPYLLLYPVADNFSIIRLKGI